MSLFCACRAASKRLTGSSDVLVVGTVEGSWIVAMGAPVLPDCVVED